MSWNTTIHLSDDRFEIREAILRYIYEHAFNDGGGAKWINAMCLYEYLRVTEDDEQNLRVVYDGLNYLYKKGYVRHPPLPTIHDRQEEDLPELGAVGLTIKGVDHIEEGLSLRPKEILAQRVPLEESIHPYSKLRLAFGCLVAVAGVTVLFVPPVRTWHWLQSHPNRIGVIAAWIVMVLGTSWAIADLKRQQFALGSVVLGALLVLIQILGK